MSDISGIPRQYAPHERFNLWEVLPDLFGQHVRLSGFGGVSFSREAFFGLWPSLVFALGWFSLRHLSKTVIFPSFARAVGLRSRIRISKFSYQCWLTTFYVSSCLVGMVVLSGREFHEYPLSDRGGASMYNERATFADKELEWYLIYQLGFCIAELFAIFLEPKRKDFYEYLLHHLVTVALIVGCSSGSFHRAGVWINFIHDVPDVFLGIAKLCNYAKVREPITNTMFGLFVVSFAYLRLYCLPLLTWMHLTVIPYVMPAYIDHYILFVLLGVVLQLLHVFWFFLIIRMIVRLAKGLRGDVRSDESGDEALEAAARNCPKRRDAREATAQWKQQ